VENVKVTSLHSTVDYLKIPRKFSIRNNSELAISGLRYFSFCRLTYYYKGTDTLKNKLISDSEMRIGNFWIIN
jgi:hypothetical protein